MDQNPIRTNLRTQQPGRESFKKKLCRVGMLFALIHFTTRAHPTSNSQNDIMKGAVSCKSFDKRKTAIADHLSELDQAALFILPCKQNNEPMLEQNPDEFGIQLAQDPPAVLSMPFINRSILFPKLVKQFNLPSFSLQNNRFLQTETFGRCVGELTVSGRAPGRSRSHSRAAARHP